MMKVALLLLIQEEESKMMMMGMVQGLPSFYTKSKGCMIKRFQ